ncbi:Sua5/YciO/YrdC/YwlC family protein [Rodentibacter caecimuris]|uniref:Threonylcarbamoyl-AMP synthase n=1 Tax=Rodentibacter caecimuris TaxID=1796644 RepID=A0ABX3L106_9PAST|nr:tRNA threonylcarbamoyladenosine biosynthesis protein RimN [Rodentibacter heylii]
MNITEIAERLKQNQVVAYPTEAVFGLGCNPMSESAVKKLLILKQRSIKKGLILIAPDIEFLLPFIDQTQLTQSHFSQLQKHYPQPTTFVVPAHLNAPVFLTGQFSSIAIRISRHPAVAALCYAAGFALTSTSANLSGFAPCKTIVEVRAQFGEDFPILDLPIGNAKNPSEIRDLLTNQLIRQG